MSDKSYWNALGSEDKPESIIDRHFAITCPHCNTASNLTAVSVPRYAQLKRYRPEKVVIGYRCDACNAAVALRFDVSGDYHNNIARFSTDFEELERPMET